MSSPKDYVLSVFPPGDGADVNVKKFVVSDKNDYFVEKLKIPLIALTSMIIIAYSGIVLNKIHRDFPARANGDVWMLNQQHLVTIGVLAVCDMLLVLRQRRLDTIIVMKDIGVQLHSEGSWKYFGENNKQNCFIPQAEIMDLVIHEGFLGFGQVIFYMCVLTKTKSKNGEGDDGNKVGFHENLVKIVFPEFLPRKDILLEVWKQSRQVLFGTSRRYFRRVPGQGLKEVQ